MTIQEPLREPQRVILFAGVSALRMSSDVRETDRTDDLN